MQLVTFYSEPTQAKSGNILTIKTEPVGSVFFVYFKHSDLKVVSQIIFIFLLDGWGKTYYSPRLNPAEEWSSG